MKALVIITYMSEGNLDLNCKISSTVNNNSTNKNSSLVHAKGVALN